MRILFLHPAFPGPFQHLATCFGAMADTTVLFLSERHRREVKIAGVRRLLLPGPEETESRDSVEREVVQALRRGANAANAMLRLQGDGFYPDIVCSASGTGCGFYAKDIFPKAFHMLYADWFYTKGANHTFFSGGKARSPADFAPARVRNLCQFNALTEGDLALTYTHWQKAQFPPFLSEAVHVLHPGVDTDFFSPQVGERFAVDGCQVSSSTELVTFSGRSLEPFRGFPQFAKSLSQILAARPCCHVLIMASGSLSSQGTAKPAQQDDVPAELSFLSWEERQRVHFLGFRPYAEYRKLLRASTVHVYLTAPFALSAGLFEAMSCGCLVVGADTEPVREVIQHGGNGFLCDFWNVDSISKTVIGLLDMASAMQPIRDAARNTILEHYNSALQIPRHLNLILSSYEAWKNKQHHKAV